MARAQVLCAISKFFERDIDMLVAEELTVSEAFGRWVLGDKVSSAVAFPANAARVSVVEDGSEADVVADFERADGGTHRLFIEDKIDAVLQPLQLERYIRRGEADVRRGLALSFSVALFCPSSYQVPLPAGVHRRTFEDAATFFRTLDDPRAAYRASFLEKAVPLLSPARRDNQVAATDPFIKHWWDAVYAMLEEEFPNYFVHRTRYPRSVYFAPSTRGQAGYLRLDLKGHKGEVDLSFKNIPYQHLLDEVGHIPSLPGVLIENERSTAIRISGLDPFVISDGMSIIGTKVRAAYAAAHGLLSFAAAHRSRLDRLAAERDAHHGS